MRHRPRPTRPSSCLAGASGLAKVLSGGTDLLVQMRSGRVKPELIVDTKRIPGIIGIRQEDGGFRHRRGDAGRRRWKPMRR